MNKRIEIVDPGYWVHCRATDKIREVIDASHLHAGRGWELDGVIYTTAAGALQVREMVA